MPELPKLPELPKIPEFRLGRHINISGNFITIPWYAKSLGYSIFQIFLGTPYVNLSKAIDKDLVIKFGSELTKRNMLMVVHGSYTINLCHDPQSTRFEQSLKSLVQDLNATSFIGKRCLGVVIHMGKNIPANNISDTNALDNYVIGIKNALAATPASTCIILETGASQGSEIGSKIDKLALIYQKLSKAEKKRVTFCIDTCHIWATGYDISSSANVKAFFDIFDNKIGIDKISCIHFNDSRTKLNSHVDRHADLGYGFIGEIGLRAIAVMAKKYNIPLIAETPLDSIDPATGKNITFDTELAVMKMWSGVD